LLNTLKNLKESGFISESEKQNLETKASLNLELKNRIEKEIGEWLTNYYKSSSPRMSASILMNIIVLITFLTKIFFQ
jgi:hypothetical protein